MLRFRWIRVQCNGNLNPWTVLLVRDCRSACFCSFLIYGLGFGLSFYPDPPHWYAGWTWRKKIQWGRSFPITVDPPAPDVWLPENLLSTCGTFLSWSRVMTISVLVFDNGVMKLIFAWVCSMQWCTALRTFALYVSLNGGDKAIIWFTSDGGAVKGLKADKGTVNMDELYQTECPVSGAWFGLYCVQFRMVFVRKIICWYRWFWSVRLVRSSNQV